MARKVLVAHASGFVGSHLSRSMVARGHLVYGTGNEKLPRGVINVGQYINSVPDQVLKEIDAVFFPGDHIAQPCSRDRLLREYFDIPKTLFNRAYRMGCRNFIYGSSTTVYGSAKDSLHEDVITNPKSEYAKSRDRFELFASRFADNHHCNVVGLRFSSIYGPGETCRPSFIHNIAISLTKSKTLRIPGSGKKTGNYIYIRDAIRSYIAAANRIRIADWENDPYAIPHRIYNIANRELVTTNQIVALLSSAIGVHCNVDYQEPEMIDDPQIIPIGRAEKEMHWTPRYNLQRGVQCMIARLINNRQTDWRESESRDTYPVCRSIRETRRYVASQLAMARLRLGFEGDAPYVP